MNQAEQKLYLDRCEHAFTQFQAAHPDFVFTEDLARKMATQLQANGLQPDNPNDLAHAWEKIRPAKSEAEERLDRSARALIEIRNWDRAAIERMTSDEFQSELQRNGRTFERVVELLVPAPEPTRRKTLGELQQEEIDRGMAHEGAKRAAFQAELDRQAAEAAQRNSEFALAVSREKKRHLNPAVAGQIPVRINTEADRRTLDEQLRRDREFLNGVADEAAERERIAVVKSRNGRGVRL